MNGRVNGRWTLLLGICLKHKISGGASLLNKFVARLAILTS